MGRRSIRDLILAEYDQLESTNAEYVDVLVKLVREMLAHEDIAVLSVTGRVKTRESLQEKLRRPANKYHTLHDVTDVAGVRIICYFADDVDRIGNILESEFDVDAANSVDKRTLLDSDRFGYLSLHHIVNLTQDRAKLREYRRFAGLPMEIQTRSILQHAWAEIEHDLGYKTTFAVPDLFRRRFARIAGLLELADQEFGEVRIARAAYRKALPERVAKAPDTVTIDEQSIDTFIRRDPLVEEMDVQIAVQFGAAKSDSVGATAQFAAERLRLGGLLLISDVTAALRKYRDDVINLATAWLRQRGSAADALSRGMSVFYLAYVIVLRSGDEERVRSFMASARLQDATEALLATWRELGN
jgi:putative GTP pyrophosphokinase